MQHSNTIRSTDVDLTTEGSETVSLLENDVLENHEGSKTEVNVSEGLENEALETEDTVNDTAEGQEFDYLPLLENRRASFNIESLNPNDSNRDLIERLHKIESGLALHLRWASLDSVLERSLQMLMCPRLPETKSCLDMWPRGLSLPLHHPKHIKTIYAVSLFRLGAETVLEKTLHGFIFVAMAYAAFDQDHKDISSLQNLYKQKDETGLINLVHVLNDIPKTFLYLIMASPLIWGTLSSAINTCLLKDLSEEHLSEFHQRLTESKPSYWLDYFRWIVPFSAYATDFKAIRRILNWDRNAYTPTYAIQAKHLVADLSNLATKANGMTQIQAMHTLKIIAHGISLRQIDQLKLPYDLINHIMDNKIKAFETIDTLLNLSKESRASMIRSIPRTVYANYLLWELGDCELRPTPKGFITVFITVFKALKLYFVIHLYLSLYYNILAAAECPEKKGFKFGIGFPQWANKYPLECFYMRINMFRSIDSSESVSQLVSEFKQYDLRHLENLILHSKSLTWNEVRQIIDALISNHAVLKTLDLSQNQISGTLPKGVFQGLDQLQFLDLLDNGLTTLPAGVFQGLGHLQSLDLELNQLTTLPAGAFQGLGQLQSLDLGLNQLTTLPAGVFQVLDQLQSLDLDNNQLTTVPAGLFQGLDRLQSLGLGFNQLTSLPAGAFQGLDRLQSLNLYWNQLTTLPAEVFQSLGHLQSLILGSNNLTTLPAGLFQSLTNLISISITGNPLKTMPHFNNATVFPKLTHLTIGGFSFIPQKLTKAWLNFLPSRLIALDLSGSALFNLSEPSLFQRFSRLKSLTLQQCTIQNIQPEVFQGLGQLQSLDLTQNAFTTLPAGAFQGLGRLQSLDLYWNQLTTLTPGAFQGLDRLQSLNLGANVFTTFPTGVFQGLGQLQSLDLYSNQLTTLPARVFQGLDRLQSLDLRENRLNDSAVLGLLSIRSHHLQSLQLNFNQLEEKGIRALQKLLMCMNISNSPKDTNPIDFRYNKISAEASKAITKGIQKQMLSRVCNDFKCLALVSPGTGQSCYWNNDKEGPPKSNAIHRRLNQPHSFFFNASTELEPSQIANRLTVRNAFQAKPRNLLQGTHRNTHSLQKPMATSTLLLLSTILPTLIYICLQILRSLKSYKASRERHSLSCSQQPIESMNLVQKTAPAQFEYSATNPLILAKLTMQH